MRLGSSTDKKDSGRLHVDFAQARDDFYEWECKQRMRAREERHRRKLEEDRLRPPSPPAIMHYSEHEAALLADKLKGRRPPALRPQPSPLPAKTEMLRPPNAEALCVPLALPALISWEQGPLGAETPWLPQAAWDGALPVTALSPAFSVTGSDFAQHKSGKEEPKSHQHQPPHGFLPSELGWCPLLWAVRSPCSSGSTVCSHAGL